VTGPSVRAARPEDADAVVALLYETATGMYDMYTGSRGAAWRVLSAAYERPGNTASREVVHVAELDGRIAGVIAVFPVLDGDPRARRFLRLTLSRTPPWRWPRALKVFRLGGRLTPPAPGDALYVDALATSPDFRRRGVATALLHSAEELARASGLAQLALDTADRNAGAQALYETFGMERSGTTEPLGPIPGSVAYVKPV
jgi:ribosomal protein S18 acetylase RimI-like enzyme